MGRPKKRISPKATVFSLNGRKSPEALQRQEAVTSQVRWDEDTMIYGENDNLPLKIAKLVSESPATSAALGTIAKFIKGARFSDPALMNIKVDKYGTTLWQFHSMIAETLAMFRGFSIRFTFNALSKITNSYILPFEHCRLKKPDKQGFINEIKFNPYFGTSEFRREMTESYPVYNIQAVPNQISKEGTKFKGQVYYYGETSPLYRFYPVPKYWSAKKWIEVDARIQDFHANNLENNFFLSVIFKMIGDPNAWSQDPAHQQKYLDDNNVEQTRPTKTVEQAFNEAISENFAGSSKAGIGMSLWSQNKDEAVQIDSFPSTANAELFQTLQEITDEKITQATQVPGILANIQRGVNLGSGGSEIQKTVELMQSRVAEDQELLEQFYNNVLLPNLEGAPAGQVEIVNFTPVTHEVTIEDKFWNELSKKEKLDFISNNVPGVKISPFVDETVSDQRTLIEVIGVGGSQALLNILTLFAQGQLTESQATNILVILFGISQEDALKMLQKEAVIPQQGQQQLPEQEPEQQINENLKNLTGRQLQGVLRISRKFNKGEVTFEQAMQLLKEGFGLTDEQANVWLITPDEE